MLAHNVYLRAYYSPSYFKVWYTHPVRGHQAECINYRRWHAQLDEGVGKFPKLKRSSLPAVPRRMPGTSSSWGPHERETSCRIFPCASQKVLHRSSSSRDNICRRHRTHSKPPQSTQLINQSVCMRLGWSGSRTAKDENKKKLMGTTYSRLSEKSGSRGPSSLLKKKGSQDLRALGVVVVAGRDFLRSFRYRARRPRKCMLVIVSICPCAQSEDSMAIFLFPSNDGNERHKSFIDV
jgi:hypothetical protein